MSEKVLIVHGYSDGSKSFAPMAALIRDTFELANDDVRTLDYKSMDDDATFEDFADKLDTEYEVHFKGARINVVCHSTGSLVVRAWLALRRIRQRRRGQPIDCPVKRLLLFAPANFGSDLAKMGRSFLGRIRTTFFNPFSDKDEDFLESGKVVLEGLEPASPIQWRLSHIDLLAEDYFAPGRPPELTCYPFVFAAGNHYGGLQARIIKARKKPGTDGTVRICGTSMNVRKVTIRFSQEARHANVAWHPSATFADLPFAVLTDFNHGSIVKPDEDGYDGPLGPLRLLKTAMAVTDTASYRSAAAAFRETGKKSYAQRHHTHYLSHRHQQFFFHVTDDVGKVVSDYHIDFNVVDAAGVVDMKLSAEFDEAFEGNFHKHSASPAHRVLMVNLSAFRRFAAKLKGMGRRLAFDVIAKSDSPNVTYRRGYFVVHDPDRKPDGPAFLYPNTTTLVELILDRVQKEDLLVINT